MSISRFAATSSNEVPVSSFVEGPKFLLIFRSLCDFLYFSRIKAALTSSKGTASCIVFASWSISEEKKFSLLS